MDAPTLAHRFGVGERAPTLTLRDARGEPVELSALWAERPLLLAFLRHFGCVFCRAELARLAKLRPSIEAAGAALVVVVNNSPTDAAAHCAEHAPGVACLGDESGQAYGEFGLSRGGLSQMFGPEVWAAGVKLTAEGRFNGMRPNNNWQMPGVFVVAASGVFAFAYYSRHAGDYPSDEAILRALKAAF